MNVSPANFAAFNEACTCVDCATVYEFPVALRPMGRICNDCWATRTRTTNPFMQRAASSLLPSADQTGRIFSR